MVCIPLQEARPPGTLGMMKTSTLIADGACSAGVGGWAYVLRYGTHEMEGAGGERDTTNNRMEIQAALAGLRALRQPCRVVVVSDSQYLLKGLSTWRHTWKAQGWRRSRRKKVYPVANTDLWMALDAEAAKHEVETLCVKGHSGHLDNERCDRLAVDQVRALRVRG